jgi:hypothetical protein
MPARPTNDNLPKDDRGLPPIEATNEQVEAGIAQARIGNRGQPFMQFQLHMRKTLTKTYGDLGQQGHRQPRRDRYRKAAGQLTFAISNHMAGAVHLRNQ